MSVRYLDSSAFVKTVVPEPQSEALRSYLARRSSLVSSSLLRAEAMRAVLHAGSEAITAARTNIRAVALVAVTDEVLDAAGLLQPIGVRTLDAIHLATALALGDDLEAIVTYDRRMVEAAAALGLPVVSPGA